MARAETYTWLSLDRWSEIVGLSRWGLNGFYIDDCELSDACPNIFYQLPEQNEMVSREELAFAIRQAEDKISDYIGYNLIPDWDVETLATERHRDPILTSNVTTQWQPKSIQVDKYHLVNVGIRRSELIEANIPVVRFDFDGDGLAETVQIDLITEIDKNEIRFYYPGEDGEDSWEIRPLKFRQIADGWRVTFPIWLIVKPEPMYVKCPNPLDRNDNDLYLETVDAYRVYNDADVQIKLIYHPTTCNLGSVIQNGSFIKDHKLGYIVYNPNLHLEPDQVEINYYSGWKGKTSRPLVDMDPFWETTVAYLAISLLDKHPRDCDHHANVGRLISHWRERFDVIQPNARKEPYAPGRYVATTTMIENIFGYPSRGAWYAYKNCQLPNRKLR